MPSNRTLPSNGDFNGDFKGDFNHFGPLTDSSGHQYVDNQPKWAIWVFAGCMVLWGIQGGVQGGPAEALFADSVDTGSRSKWYSI